MDLKQVVLAESGYIGGAGAVRQPLAAERQPLAAVLEPDHATHAARQQGVLPSEAETQHIGLLSPRRQRAALPGEGAGGGGSKGREPGMRQCPWLDRKGCGSDESSDSDYDDDADDDEWGEEKHEEKGGSHVRAWKQKWKVTAGRGTERQ